MESMRWSEAKRWEEETLGERSPPQPLLGLGEYESSSRSSVGWQSLNSVSPVWQRPILMGEKCEFPRFSGLILYDERGRLLDHSLASSHEENIDQVSETTINRSALERIRIFCVYFITYKPSLLTRLLINRIKKIARSIQRTWLLQLKAHC